MVESNDKPRVSSQSSAGRPVSRGVGSGRPGGFQGGGFQAGGNQGGGGPRPHTSPGGFGSGAGPRSGPAGGARRGQMQRPQNNDQHRTNEQIRVPEVMLIGTDGEQFGVMSTYEARQRAEEAGLDLVEVSPNSKPPVCKLMDYGKFRYKEQKRLAEAKKNRTENTTKEIRLRYCTDSGDLSTKLTKARSFIESGDKVKFSMRFKGREAMFANIGDEKLDMIVESLKDIATVDERQGLSGRSLFMTLAPIKKK